MRCLLHRIFIALIFTLFTPMALAVDPIVFKQPFSPHNGWLSYGIAVIVLLIIVLVIAKKHRPNVIQKSVCQLIEKKYLGNKTVVYVIDYQQQRFLLADNQHALAFHALIEGSANEQV